jgi:cysteinyl-tRNA synthetase
MTYNALELRLYNTLTRTKEAFEPIDRDNVRMYVCGPTVYDYAHIGNARPAIVFDVLFRLLRHRYGADSVTYVRNITDVDDKINARALRDYGDDIGAGRLSLNEAIRKITEPTFEQYQKDVTALGCLPPTHQPRATEYVLPRADGRADMVSLIQSLIDRRHAYAAAGEILFDTASMADYGQLSKRPLDEQQAGARIAVDAHKKSPADFVLWKSSSADEPGWDATFTVDGESISIHGRPGWHIECSAMSDALLWDAVKDRLSPAGHAHPHQFDIHGGGLDLIFPHHENEIAQSRCGHGTHAMANVWMHNGFVQVEGRKMSKSEGNFVTIHDLLETTKFGGRKWPGEVLRLAMLMTHYREPIDFSVRRLEEAEARLNKWRRRVEMFSERDYVPPDTEVILHLASDLSIAGAFNRLDDISSRPKDDDTIIMMTSTLNFLGFHQQSAEQAILSLVPTIQNYAETRALYTGPYMPETELTPWIMTAIAHKFLEKRNARYKLMIEKNWAEADRIRDELLAQGIQLKDGKDPATGERVTTWEVKR